MKVEVGTQISFVAVSAGRQAGQTTLMNEDHEPVGSEEATTVPTGRDQAVDGVAEAWSGAISSVRRQLARVHEGLPPVEEEPPALPPVAEEPTALPPGD
ncbi:hypothetical protein [Streptomyces chryseus]|uniref:hypothetical protein n=1 Tax=Streptomyces chryseus TaxID=68186 RepID=UPI0016793A18|nr:hypothetical protein [Streptomyces chryseus]GGX42657.1 hypothetical protein GCM10010353_67280 [Streptomyces chryseus]